MKKILGPLMVMTLCILAPGCASRADPGEGAPAINAATPVGASVQGGTVIVPPLRHAKIGCFVAGDGRCDSKSGPVNLLQSKAETPLLGRWKVRFTNGVKEVCQFEQDGTASVVEPLRRAVGNTEVRGRSVVLFCQDDRVERWTSVDRRFVVEHWFPASCFESGVPVLGIADPLR